MPANLTNIKDQGVDIADTYVGLNDINSVSESYLSTAGLNYKLSGSMWSWGYNDVGSLGLGDIVRRSSPTQVGSLTGWIKVNASSVCHAIDSNNRLWAWGYSNDGALGLGTTTGTSSPVQVGALTNWKTVSGQGNGAAAVKTDGTLWAWGNNFQGQLGQSNQTYYSSPVQVGTGTDWLDINIAFSAYGIKKDNSLWSWGFNAYGQLGDGTATRRSSPVQVGALGNWKQVSQGFGYMLSVKTDGTLWACGNNGDGQLGLGDRTHRSSPVQVGSLTNWKQVACTYSVTHAVKTDGTLWAWGGNINNYGELGLNSLVHRSSPVQVGSMTNWSGIYSNGSYTPIAIKTDGTMWSWGLAANYGSTGVGDLVNRSSPVQIGSLTNWKSASSGGAVSLAIRG